MNFDISSCNPFQIDSEEQFNEVALKIFHFQKANNEIYGRFAETILDVAPTHYTEIPFLPITFFKSHQVVAAKGPFDLEFRSSGTTGDNSYHFVKDASIYEESFDRTIKMGYPDIEERAILAVLPNYVEQGSSSLVYMVDRLIGQSKHPKSGFYLNEPAQLARLIVELDDNNVSTLLIGVSYALLDIVEQHHFQLKHAVIMETGGMKGRRKEMIRSELHAILEKGFGVKRIHSEYGMTELLSQAYSQGGARFTTPAWMKVLVRDVNDPIKILPAVKSGGINIIDLANVYSCSFIATQDLGRTHLDGSFEVIGRFDNSDLRGCNLMVI